MKTARTLPVFARMRSMRLRLPGIMALHDRHRRLKRINKRRKKRLWRKYQWDNCAIGKHAHRSFVRDEPDFNQQRLKARSLFGKSKDRDGNGPIFNPPKFVYLSNYSPTSCEFYLYEFLKRPTINCRVFEYGWSRRTIFIQLKLAVRSVLCCFE